MNRKTPADALQWHEELRRLSDLVPYDKNPRTISKPQAAKLKRSLKENGYHARIAINTDGVIAAGHMRRNAMMEMKEWGPEAEVPVLVPNRPLTQEEFDEVNLRDNVEFGSFDVKLLGMRFEQTYLTDLGLAVDLGLGKKGNTPAKDPDETPATPTVARTKHGDLYEVGPHRLLCGDSTSAEQVARLMDNQRAAMAIADPPYNVGYEYNEHKDDRPAEDYEMFCHAYTDNALSHAPFVAITPGKVNELAYRKRPDFKEYMTWYKKFGVSRGSFYKAMVTEPILLLGEKPKGKFYPTDCLEFMTDREKDLRKLHSCPKPVALWCALMEPMTEPGQLVLEMFGGSGTAMVAAHKTERVANLMEIDPRYCDVIVSRMLDIYPDLKGQLKLNGEIIAWQQAENDRG